MSQHAPFILSSHSTPRTWLANDYGHFLLTSSNSPGTLGLFQAIVPPGGGNPLHRHSLEDESFYILEGSLRFCLNNHWIDAHPGDFIYAPRNSLHNFSNPHHSPARILISVTPPSTFEAFVAACGARWAGEDLPPLDIQQDAISRMISHASQYGLTIVPSHQPQSPLPCPPRTETVNVLGDSVRLLTDPAETHGTFGVIEVTSRPGGGPPPHTHPHEEAFFVLEGQLDVFDGNSWHTLSPGSLSYVPPGAPHTYRNSTSSPAKFLVYFTPADLTDMFRTLGQISFPPVMRHVTDICRRHQCVFLT